MINSETCPYCNSREFIKYGKYRNLQRYQCKSCSKTFNEGTGLIWHNTRKSTITWDKYCRLMLSGYTIRQCACSLKISIKTSFKWRHKILNHLSKYTNTRSVNNLIGARHTFYKENFKGQKKPPVTIKRSNRKNVFIMATINDFKYSLAKISFIGHSPSRADIIRLKDELKPSNNAFFIARGDRFISSFSKFLNGNKTIEISNEKRNSLISSCREFIVAIRRWFSKFRSVSTKYLNKYLNWFIYIYEGSIFKTTELSNIISSIFCTKHIS